MLSPLELALLSCALLGLRHGFDYDHLAAITDITSVQRTWREGMKLGLLYALGHAFTVALLGAGVIFLHLRLPAGMDVIGERLVGATLIVLAVYVFIAFLRRGSSPHRHAVPPSRIALLFTGIRYGAWRLRKLIVPETPQPDSFSFRYDRLFLSSGRTPRLQALVTSLTAAYSLIIGTIFLFGVSDKLPPLLH